MYLYLEENTNAYHKAQLTPFFIAILTILIIGIMVTVNIGKVSQIKTHTSNSADAGALAAASAMGSSFNALGAYSSYMYVLYLDQKDVIERLLNAARDATFRMIGWIEAAAAAGVAAIALACPLLRAGKSFYIAMMVLALVFLGLALYELQNQLGIMQAVKGSIEELHRQQQQIYKSTREMVNDNVASARIQALSLGFANSGVSAMLTDDQQDEYRDFISGLSGSFGEYSWQDGQDRGHTVSMGVGLKDVVDYQLWETNSDFDQLIKSFWMKVYYGLYTIFITGELPPLIGEYNKLRKGAASTGDCPAWVYPNVDGNCVIPGWCRTWARLAGPVVKNTIGDGVLAAAFFLVFDDIEEGIQENGTFPTDKEDLGKKIATTVADVEHCRCLSLNSKQTHEGSNLTLWETDYPDAVSESDASFSGGNLDGHGITGVGHVPRLTETR
ncbi:MAG: pilus assembly protein TadG-related protein [Bacteroidales bacterium]